MIPPAIKRYLPPGWALGYATACLVLLLERSALEWIPTWFTWLVLGVSLPVGVHLLLRAAAVRKQQIVSLAVAGSLAYVLWWQWLVISLDLIEWSEARAQVARIGLGGLFLLGLLWVVWTLERSGQHYRRQRDALPEPPEDPNCNPLDQEAWYYGLRPRSLWQVLTGPLRRERWRLQEKSRKLDQSVAALITYSYAFLLVCLLASSLGGCWDIYEMPAGGGEQATQVQVVKIQKVIRKKFVVNPFSAISFEVPPIDEVKLELTEATKHAYKVGYGEGEGAGFAGGTKMGKVGFIRLEYSGGDWDQDFGIGGDLNMLIEYGVRTRHQIAKRTESRRVAQLKNFPPEKSPPMVYMTGQRNISLSNAEIKILHEYIEEKHGMLFADNGGSRHFHNQFLALMNRVLPDVRPVRIPLDDVIHRIPNQIPFLPYVAPHGGKEALGWYKNGRWMCYYHPGDIGDAWSDGHAGVEPEVYEACYQLGTNVIFYAHTEYAKWLEARKSDN